MPILDQHYELGQAIVPIHTFLCSLDHDTTPTDTIEIQPTLICLGCNPSPSQMVFSHPILYYLRLLSIVILHCIQYSNPTVRLGCLCDASCLGSYILQFPLLFPLGSATGSRAQSMFDRFGAYYIFSSTWHRIVPLNHQCVFRLGHQPHV